MTSKEVRKSFIEFFKQQAHTAVPSASVVPLNDPTLLFTNAGMNQFKPIFLGQETRDYTRAVDTQKCIRVSGKHNDLEEVGQSLYHHTFFEMLGNWSFGDYFKREAIAWAWELMTAVWKMPKDKLYATVYEDDDEAEELWRKETDIAHDHILRCGKKDNFWEMGETGPCGPCSEIHIDRGPEYDDDPNAFVNTGSPRYIELWNLVFIQFNRQADGTLEPLPQKHVDTGAGLERITAVLGGKHSNYETDLFMPLMERIQELSGKTYTSGEGGTPHRVIADHVRCLTFALCDGAMPGNEGRGYVLRRILRRASRFGRKLDMHEPFIHKLVPILVDQMGDTFPELKARHQHASLVIKAEEEHFGKTLDRGLEIFEEITQQTKKAKKKIISGKDVFRLYDTFGFPLDLTELMAREQNLGIDEEAFHKAMSEQKRRSRESSKFDYSPIEGLYQNVVVPEKPRESKYLGQEILESKVRLFLYAKDPSSDLGSVVLDRTPFYPESGGQIGDKGELHGDSVLLKVLDTHKLDSDRYLYLKFHVRGDGIVHIVRLEEGTLDDIHMDMTLTAKVDQFRRIPTQYNHTATHLLHKALRETLGDHVHQQGSHVAPDHMRFDYSHFQKPAVDKLSDIEKLVNEMIRANFLVTPHVLSLKQARELGAMALFGEKYDEEVRMIQIGETDELLPWGDERILSRELCGGCHVHRTGDMGLFVIRAETAAAAGIRRIEALTGSAALQYLADRSRTVDAFTEELASHGSDVLNKLRKTLDEKKGLEKELAKVKAEIAGGEMKSLAASAIDIAGVKFAHGRTEADSLDQLKEIGDALRDGLKSGIGLLVTLINSKPHIVCVVTPDLVAKGVDAVPIVKQLGKRIQGGGGGKPHLATAGGRNPDGLEDILKDAPQVVQDLLQIQLKSN